MGIESNALGFIRGIISEPNRYALPMAPQIANYATVGAYGAGGFGFMNNTYSQSVMNYLAIDQDTVTRYVDYEDLDDAPLPSSALDIYCLAADTMIFTAEGEIAIADLAKRYKRGEKFPILAYNRQEKRFVGAWAHSPHKTKTAQVVKITFDDGSFLKCTPDHKILNRKSEWVEAKDLKQGDRVMPGTITVNKKRGYLTVTNPEQPKTDKQSRLVEIHKIFGQFYYGDIGLNNVLHHEDENKFNNSKKNLSIVSRSQHASIHLKDKHHLARLSVAWKMKNKNKWADDNLNYEYEKNYGPKGLRIKIDVEQALSVVRKNEFMRSAAKELGVNETTLCRHLLRAGIDYRKEIGTDFYNHKVVNVEWLGEEDVYDMTTDIHHNFIANGIVVHNCDDACQVDPDTNRTLWVTSSDETIRRDLDNMLFKKLMIEENIWMNTRTLAKYGNWFGELIVRKDKGVVGINPLPPPTMRRIEIGTGAEAIIGFMYDPSATFRMTTGDFIGKLQSRIQDGGMQSSDYYHKSDSGIVFEDWEMIHGRLRGKNPYSQYGYGIFEPARWIFKRLTLLEDSLVMYRITRAPSRYAFYIDVSSIPPNETQSYLNKVRQAMKQQKFTNNNTSKQDLKFHAISPQDDFFLPVRDGKESTRVESLTGPVYDAIEDVRYFENKLFAALKVPKPFLTYEESTAKTNLSAEDTRFARTIMRVQREVKNSYRKACQVHLAAKGISPDRVEFDVNMTIPSAIFELAQMEIRNAEIELAEKFGAFAPRGWIMKHILKFSDAQISEMERIRQQEDGETPEDTSGGGSSGALDKVLSKRHEEPVAISAEEPQTAGESRGYKMGSDEYLTRGLKKDVGTLVERLEEARHRDKKFDSRWNRMTSLLEEMRQTVKR